MQGIVSAFIAALITVPVLGYLMVFVISKQITRNHRRSVKLAVDLSTLLLVLSVHFLIVTIWNKSFIWLIVLVMLVIAVLFVWVHWKVKEEIVLMKVFKGYWRFNFLLFLSVYIILVLFGLFQRLTFLLSLP